MKWTVLNVWRQSSQLLCVLLPLENLLWTKFRDYAISGVNISNNVHTCFFQKKTGPLTFEHRKTQHGGRQGEQEQVTMCWRLLCVSRR